jgi:hypothetical protein
MYYGKAGVGKCVLMSSVKGSKQAIHLDLDAPTCRPHAYTPA